MSFVDVAVPGVGMVLTYKNRPERDARAGEIVLVSVKDRCYSGVVLGDAAEFPNARTITGLTGWRIPDSLMRLAGWVAEYYMCSLPEAVRLMMPPGLPEKQKVQIKVLKEAGDLRIRGRVQKQLLDYLLQRRSRWLSLDNIIRKHGQPARDLVNKLLEQGLCEIRTKNPEISTAQTQQFIQLADQVFFPEKPTQQQTQALGQLAPLLHQDSFKSVLLHGETGSGKTALYTWLAKQALSLGKGVIILVPEISLTPQVASVIQKGLGTSIAVYHSAFTNKERTTIWHQLATGERKVVLGPRSALTLPVQNLGLIVVDEEHDDSYKSNQKPFYHARDLAAMRAKNENALLVLASATPSSESYANALKNKHLLITMPEKAPGYTQPVVRLIDMREREVSGVFSAELLDALRNTVRSGHQAILFLNRRGYAPYYQCLRCGTVLECPDCSVAYTYHKDTKRLVCHLCGRTQRAPDQCPSCGSTEMWPMRYGVQRVVENLRALLPDCALFRLDRDVSRRKHGPQEVLQAFGQAKAGVLVGTQLVTKGLDFPGVKMVGVLNADTGLFGPDFRAEERTFQLLRQVIGRLRTGGQVYIQSYAPENKAIKLAVKGDYTGFMQQELEQRKRHGYPPFSKLILIETRSKEPAKAMGFLKELKNEITQRAQHKLQVLGPSSAPHPRIASKWRFRLLIKTSKGMSRDLAFLAGIKAPASVQIKIDVDPVDMG